MLTVTGPDGRLLSSVLSFYFRDEVLPYYAGDDEAARDLAANDFKYWELMRRACARGLKVFDYGRSKQGTGPYAFKKNWGFEPQPLHYEYCLYKRDAVPQNNPSNAKYKLLIETWRRMPIGLANCAGADASCAAWADRPRWPICSTWCTACRTRPTRATRCARTTCSSTWWRATACSSAPSSTTRKTSPMSTPCAHWCADLHAHPAAARCAPASPACAACCSGEALTLRYYRDAGLRQWVQETLAHEKIDAAIVFSSSMAQYAELRPGLPTLVDFVDVDSAKWTQYADQHRWPMSWLYRREGRELLAYERAVAARSKRSFFVTEKETALFRQLAPECAPTASRPMSNGVDADFFSPRRFRAVAVSRPAKAAGLHRRHGLLAQRRRRDMVRARHAAGAAPALARPALPHRRPQPHAGRARAGR